MVKHTQTIRRQQPTNCLSVFDWFVGLELKGLKTSRSFPLGAKGWLCSACVLSVVIYESETEEK